jgi:hypothetical protein
MNLSQIRIFPLLCVFTSLNCVGSAAHTTQPIDSFDHVGIGHFEGAYDGVQWVSLDVNVGDQFNVTATLLQNGTPILGGLYLYYPVGDSFADVGDGLINGALSHGASGIFSGAISVGSVVATAPGRWAFSLWNETSNTGGLTYKIDVTNTNSVPDAGSTAALLLMALAGIAIRKRLLPA